jgi:hypothetical protein
MDSNPGVWLISNVHNNHRIEVRLVCLALMEVLELRNAATSAASSSMQADASREVKQDYSQAESIAK